MSCREPKVLALLAQAQGRLSIAGQARLAKHLDRCPVCAAAHGHGTARALLVAIDTGREAPVPSLDWQRVERGLERELERGGFHARGGRSTRWLQVTAIAAAAVALIGIGYGALSTPQPARPQVELTLRERVVVGGTRGPLEATPPAANTDAPALLAPRWTLARMATPPTEAALTEGALLVTAAGESLHVQLEPGTGFVLEPNSSLRLARLRVGDVQLELQAGAVTSRVRTLGPTERYEVRAGAERVRVLGTRFRVALDAAATAVSVDEGVIEVVNREEVRLALLKAPAAWPAAAAPFVEGLTEPYASLVALPDWPLLRLSGLERARAVEVGDARISAPGELAVRVPPGDVELRVAFVGGPSAATRVRAEGVVLELDAAKLRRGAPVAEPAAAPEPTSGTTALASVLHRSSHALQRCYQRSLLKQPNLEGRFSLRVRIGADGRVGATELTAPDAVAVPTDLPACVAELTARWQFPSHMAGAELQAPLRFSRAEAAVGDRPAP